MKTIFLKAGVILLAAVLIFSGCNTQPKVKQDKGTNSKGQTSSVEVEVFDAVKLKDQIVEIFKTAPKLSEFMNSINEVGVTYMLELTVPPENVEKYITVYDQCLAIGMYDFDVLYARAYNRQDIIAQLFPVQKNLIGKIGLEKELAAMKKYDNWFKRNQGNSDSLNAVVSDVMNEVAKSYHAGEYSGVYALLSVSANVEGLYILTQTALMAKNKTKILDLIGKQRERVNTCCQLLEVMSGDKNVAPIFEKMKPILANFTDDQPFTEKKLAEVAPLIEQMRKGFEK
ncbi:MAG TPA: hypothetical protein VIK10_08790 [Prolixibacteraceae bacterium]